MGESAWPVPQNTMADQLLFCPHCGMQQLKTDARFCHVCGQPIPAVSAHAAEPIVLAPKRPRRLSAWWLLPLPLVGVMALVLLAWEPARSRVADLLAGIRPAATAPASREPDTSARAASGDATKGPTQGVSVAPTETPAASPTVAVPPSATPQPSVTSLPTATPPPTATLVPTATPFTAVTKPEIVHTGSLGLIAFYSERDGNAEIYIMDANGGNQRRLTSDPASDLYPALSPDGRRIAFVSQRDGNSEIYLVDSDGSDLVRITNDAAEDRLPVWSPDGKRIAFSSDRSGNANLYVMDANGQNLVQLTSGPERDGHPTWSPDGARLAFNTGDEPASWEIETISAADGARRRLTENGVIDWSPNWATNGSKILFLSRRSTQNAIYVVAPYGGEERKVFDGLESIWGAVWSPDGQHIAFTSNESGRDEIYVIRSDGSDLRQLTSEGGAYPSWR